MSKKARLDALNKKLDVELEGVRKYMAKILLWMFIKGFKIKRFFGEEDNILKKIGYIIIAIPLFSYGYILDVCVNQAVGPQFFGRNYGFGTLTATLWRVKKEGKAAKGYAFAMQICEVLNDYDESHC